MITDGNKLVREIFALLMVCTVALIVLSLYSYSPLDSAFNHQAPNDHKTANLAGTLGAYLAAGLVDLSGGGAWLWPIVLILCAAFLFFPTFRPAWWRWLGGILVIGLVPFWLERGAQIFKLSAVGVSGGGFIGRQLLVLGTRFLGAYGALLVAGCLSLIGVQLVLGLSYRGVAMKMAMAFINVRALFTSRSSSSAPAPRTKAARQSRGSSSKERGGKDKETPLIEERPVPENAAVDAGPVRQDPTAPTTPLVGILPGVELLSSVPSSRTATSKAVLEKQGQALATCFAEFGIQGEVQGIEPGPVITMFEFKPAPGIKVSRIAGMGDDLALALKARAVRIVAPLPGRDTVGIEIPNEERQTVYLREILEDAVFTKNKGQLPLALGKDTRGIPKIADLAKMPHMLVAGATGAGKSVCLNCLLLSLVYKHSPEHVKLLLVDPKRIELAVYGTLPHLVHPVVTDMHLAKNALEWAVCEMEQRYEAMARAGVRHITTYNQKLRDLGANRSEDLLDLQPFPYLVVVIDELADLMMTAAKDVEGSIVRLAQLARASGIHLILATQRPSVDVVTGIIKANFPSRIAFQVSSKHDSRTILDGIGAEHLLGQGDMLYKMSGGGMQRVHGAFVGDEEIARVVEFWEQQQPQQFELDFAQWGTSGDAGGMNGDIDASDVLNDPKYDEAIEFVTEQGRASISMIQRRLRIGFNRAARFIEQMEADGLVGPQDGSKPRLLRKN